MAACNLQPEACKALCAEELYELLLWLSTVHRLVAPAPPLDAAFQGDALLTLGAGFDTGAGLRSPRRPPLGHEGVVVAGQELIHNVLGHVTLMHPRQLLHLHAPPR